MCVGPNHLGMSVTVCELCLYFAFSLADPEGVKSQKAIGFLRNSGTDPLEKQLGPGSNCFSTEVSTALCEICY